MSKHSPFTRKRGQAARPANVADWLALFIATGCGTGFIPLGPGTWGSLVGVLLAYGLIAACGGNVVLLQNALLLAGLLLTWLGIWAGTRAETLFARKDASQITIDEVAGQVISFVFIAPYLTRLGANLQWALLAGFTLFRVFDMFKPYPINKLQDLTGGFGVVMDDVLAGIYAASTLSLLLYFFTL
jgi:phosphatidylglycerophosphatase A